MGVKGNNYPDREPMSWMEAIISAIELVIYIILLLGGTLLVGFGPLVIACKYNLAWLLLYIPIIILVLASEIHRVNS